MRLVLSLGIVLLCLPLFSMAAVPAEETASSPLRILNATATAPWTFKYSEANLSTTTTLQIKYPKKQLLSRYEVKKNALYDGTKRLREDNIDHRIWDLFLKIAGDDFTEKHIGWYTTFRNPKTNVLGRVELIRAHDEPGWGLAVNANAADFENEIWRRHMSVVLVHEFAHILTLNSDELNHQKKKKKFCTTYLSAQGCAEADSYINEFVSRFWTEEDLTHRKTDKKYYKDHGDDFLTLHAVKKPEEDIAESFTEFIFNAKPTDTTKKKNQKVLFFYDYPELVELRTSIRTALTPYFQ